MSKKQKRKKEGKKKNIEAGVWENTEVHIGECKHLPPAWLLPHPWLLPSLLRLLWHLLCALSLILECA